MARPVVLDFIRKGSFKKNAVSKWLLHSRVPCAKINTSFSPQNRLELFRLKHSSGKIPSRAKEVLELLCVAGTKSTITPIVLKKALREVHGKFREEILSLSESNMCLFDIERIDFLDDFLKRRTLSWKALAEAGDKLKSPRGTVVDGYFEWLGMLMLSGRQLGSELGLADGPVKPYFCELCWRFKMSTRRYCSYHSPAGNSQRQENPRVGTHKSASRLKPLFDSWRKRLEGDDRKLKLRSEWRRAVDQGLLGDWIELRRPRVYEWLALSNVSASNLNEIIEVLDRVVGESAQEATLRGVFHQDLINDVAAVFTMITRAEAWMCATDERKDNWGGSRKGAGRKSTGS